MLTRPSARLAGFLLLLVLVFGAAHLAGARMGPVTGGYARSAHPPAGPGPTMNMSGITGPPGAGGAP